MTKMTDFIKKLNLFMKFGFSGFLTVFVFLIRPVQAEEQDSLWNPFSPPEIHGFCEFRGGCRMQKDPYEKDMSVMETRLQAEFFTSADWADFKYKGDVWADGITEQAEYSTREAWIFSRPADFLDVKIGRQILTWGTGDLVFLNDLFPKDWQSFFIGRDAEYLKAPSDAVKFSFFADWANLDLVYTPKFDSDLFITGDYISCQNGTGQEAKLVSDKPDHWFQDDEIAVRVYKNRNGEEYALYAYQGFWKSPGGENRAGIAGFPKLNVYGASVRGQIGPGIGNIEVAWYQSADDEGGSDPLTDNSEMRYLAGYAQDIGKDLNAALQYYVEQMLSYSDYKKNLNSETERDRYRHVITLQLTKLLMNQNLKLSVSGYYSPSDMDAHLRPNIHCKYSDRLSLETGANIFFGDSPHTFFARFEKNTNIYAAVRYSF